MNWDEWLRYMMERMGMPGAMAGIPGQFQLPSMGPSDTDLLGRREQTRQQTMVGPDYGGSLMREDGSDTDPLGQQAQRRQEATDYWAQLERVLGLPSGGPGPYLPMGPTDTDPLGQRTSPLLPEGGFRNPYAGPTVGGMKFAGGNDADPNAREDFEESDPAYQLAKQRWDATRAQRAADPAYSEQAREGDFLGAHFDYGLYQVAPPHHLLGAHDDYEIPQTDIDRFIERTTMRPADTPYADEDEAEQIEIAREIDETRRAREADRARAAERFGWPYKTGQGPTTGGAKFAGAPDDEEEPFVWPVPDQLDPALSPMRPPSADDEWETVAPLDEPVQPSTYGVDDDWVEQAPDLTNMERTSRRAKYDEPTSMYEGWENWQDSADTGEQARFHHLYFNAKKWAETQPGFTYGPDLPWNAPLAEQERQSRAKAERIIRDYLDALPELDQNALPGHQVWRATDEEMRDFQQVGKKQDPDRPGEFEEAPTAQELEDFSIWLAVRQVEGESMRDAWYRFKADRAQHPVDRDPEEWEVQRRIADEIKATEKAKLEERQRVAREQAEAGGELLAIPDPTPARPAPWNMRSDSTIAPTDPNDWVPNSEPPAVQPEDQPGTVSAAEWRARQLAKQNDEYEALQRYMQEQEDWAPNEDPSWDYSFADEDAWTPEAINEREQMAREAEQLAMEEDAERYQARQPPAQQQSYIRQLYDWLIQRYGQPPNQTGGMKFAGGEEKNRDQEKSAEEMIFELLNRQVSAGLPPDLDLNPEYRFKLAQTADDGLMEEDVFSPYLNRDVTEEDLLAYEATRGQPQGQAAPGGNAPKPENTLPNGTAWVNMKAGQEADVHIGRGTKWGNPYALGSPHPDDGHPINRTEALELYRAYMARPEQAHLLRDLPELQGMVLGCYCYPEACHGELLAQLADSVTYEGSGAHQRVTGEFGPLGPTNPKAMFNPRPGEENYAPGPTTKPTESFYSPDWQIDPETGMPYVDPKTGQPYPLGYLRARDWTGSRHDRPSEEEEMWMGEAQPGETIGQFYDRVEKMIGDHFERLADSGFGRHPVRDEDIEAAVNQLLLHDQTTGEQLYKWPQVIAQLEARVGGYPTQGKNDRAPEGLHDIIETKGGEPVLDPRTGRPRQAYATPTGAVRKQSEGPQYYGFMENILEKPWNELPGGPTEVPAGERKARDEMREGVAEERWGPKGKKYSQVRAWDPFYYDDSKLTRQTKQDYRDALLDKNLREMADARDRQASEQDPSDPHMVERAAQTLDEFDDYLVGIGKLPRSKTFDRAMTESQRLARAKAWLDNYIRTSQEGIPVAELGRAPTADEQANYQRERTWQRQMQGSTYTAHHGEQGRTYRPPAAITRARDQHDRLAREIAQAVYDALGGQDRPGQLTSEQSRGVAEDTWRREMADAIYEALGGEGEVDQPAEEIVREKSGGRKGYSTRKGYTPPKPLRSESEFDDRVAQFYNRPKELPVDQVAPYAKIPFSVINEAIDRFEAEFPEGVGGDRALIRFLRKLAEEHGPVVQRKAWRKTGQGYQKADEWGGDVEISVEELLAELKRAWVKRGGKLKEE